MSGMAGMAGMTGVAGIAGIAGMVKRMLSAGHSHGESLLAICQLGFMSHRLSVAADPQSYQAPGRNLVDHAAQLLHALHLASIDGENDVVFFESRFAGGRILIDQRHFHAVFFLELQFAQAISGDIAGIHAQIASAAEVLTGNPKDSLKGSCEQS